MLRCELRFFDVFSVVMYLPFPLRVVSAEKFSVFCCAAASPILDLYISGSITLEGSKKKLVIVCKKVIERSNSYIYIRFDGIRWLPVFQFRKKLENS